MAQVLPFRGVLYNPAQIDDLSKVVAPPYDVISEKDQRAFHDMHPKNIIRLILGNTTESDSATDNPHTRAAHYFQQWLQEKTLLQDPEDSLYLASVQFPLEDREITRYGLIAKVRLEPFDKKIVLPHEKTFSKVKSERLSLMKHCHANFSPIFSIYSDRDGILQSAQKAVADNPPDMAVTNHQGLPHNLWRITDRAANARITQLFENKQLFIADGHHRYETALQYRDWLAQKTADFSMDHPANFVLMYLASMEDPGMVILPAHRLIKVLSEDEKNQLMAGVLPYFEIEHIPTSDPARIAAAVREKSDRQTIGMVIQGRPEAMVMTLKPQVMDEMFGSEIADSLRQLDVTVLTRLVLMHITGFDQQRLDDATAIDYRSNAADAIAAAVQGECQAAFILNPTRMEQVHRVSTAGLVMPRKSTYFYPKVLSGRVMNLLTED